MTTYLNATMYRYLVIFGGIFFLIDFFKNKIVFNLQKNTTMGNFAPKKIGLTKNFEIINVKKGI